MLHRIAALQWTRRFRPITCRSVYPFSALTQVHGVSARGMSSNPLILTRVTHRGVAGWTLFQLIPRNGGLMGGWRA